jgi:hypothetical protein
LLRHAPAIGGPRWRLLLGRRAGQNAAEQLAAELVEVVGEGCRLSRVGRLAPRHRAGAEPNASENQTCEDHQFPTHVRFPAHTFRVTVKRHHPVSVVMILRV